MKTKHYFLKKFQITLINREKKEEIEINIS